MRGREVRERRRAEAEARQAAREARTPKQQLALLDARSGDSFKERAKLSGDLTPQERAQLIRRGRKAGLKKGEMGQMTNDALASSVAAAERAHA